MNEAKGTTSFKSACSRDFPGSVEATNPPSNARGVGSISGLGTKTPHAKDEARILQLLSPLATTRNSMYCNKKSHEPQLRPDAAK